jgi:hypothetical protein
MKDILVYLGKINFLKSECRVVEMFKVMNVKSLVSSSFAQ